MQYKLPKIEESDLYSLLSAVYKKPIEAHTVLGTSNRRTRQIFYSYEEYEKWFKENKHNINLIYDLEIPNEVKFSFSKSGIITIDVDMNETKVLASEVVEKLLSRINVVI